MFFVQDHDVEKFVKCNKMKIYNLRTVRCCTLYQQFILLNFFFCTLAGKYIGNRPIKLRKSTWKDRSIEAVKKKAKEKKRLGYR